MPGKQRDPAFLYYDADVALDVAHMNRVEKGCYLDLVQLYRKYHGYTMVQIGKILGNDMVDCWPAIELVLELDGDKYHIPWLRNSLIKKAERNEKQRQNVLNRWDKAKQNGRKSSKSGENGNTNSIPSYKDGTTKDIPPDINGSTNVIPIIETVTETVTEERKENENRGVGEGEREGKGLPDQPPDGWKAGDWENFELAGSRLPTAMMEIFVARFPEYPVQEGKDNVACWQLAAQLSELHGWKWQSVLNGTMEKLLEEWKGLVVWARGDPWYKTKALTFWNNNFQGLIQSKNNGSSKGPNSAKSYSGRGPTNGYDPTRINTEGIGEL